MPSVFKLAVAAAATLAVVDAACPNACSGHGQCGQYDACTCHADWFGGDCSQRVCQHATAWATTNANGDINGDGTRNGITVYDADHTFKTSGFPYVISQNSPNGAWEQWPAFGNADSKDEGHFYMECANRGLCDRSTGECTCFDGYTGAGCRRTVCPNDCSGHGICQTVDQQSGSYDYTLWDKDMSRSCVCDKGYGGFDCSERKCPLGDDPLTASDINEIQWVDIYSDRDGTEDNSFSGSFRLKYTDQTGKQWTTDAIDVVPFSSGAADMASDVAAALNGLPNGVLSGVTVTQGFAEKVVPGNMKIGTNAIAAAANAGTSYTLTNKLFRCPAGGADIVFVTTDGTNMLQYEGTAETGVSDIDDATCYEVAHQWSVRFQIKFPNQPGDLAPLEVDVSDVIIRSKTNAQHGSDLAGSAVTSTRALGAHELTNGFTADYNLPSSISDECTAACSIASKTIAGPVTTGLFDGARVRISCNGVSRGTFTVDTVTDGTNFDVVEDIADHADCGNSLEFTLDSQFIEVNADLRALLTAGDVLVVDGWTVETSPKVSSVTYDSDTGVGRVFLVSAHAEAAETKTLGATTVTQLGDGTSESDECSGRGLCDRTTGLCKCFKGYTGGACSIQNALSLGFGDI